MRPRHLTSFITIKPTRILILGHKLKMLENKKIEFLFATGAENLVIFKRIAKSRKKLIR
jgi:hypothetical protein